MAERRILSALIGLAIASPFAIVEGCAMTGPAKPLPAAAVTVSCPPLKSYSAADQKALAAALTALAPDSPLVGAMADYGALRAAVRACKAS